MHASSPPALLVPGTLCDDRLFAPMLAHLDLDATIAPPIAHATVGEAGEAVLALAPPRFIAIGFSLGGFVCLDLLCRAPERITALVLISGNAQAIQPETAAARRDEVEFARDVGWAALIGQLWPRYVGQAFRAKTALEAKLVAMAEAVGLERFAMQAELAISRPDRSAALRTSTVPYLVVSGFEDAMTPRERYRATANVPRGHWTELEGVGHFAPLEAPAACASAITNWLGVASCY